MKKFPIDFFIELKSYEEYEKAVLIFQTYSLNTNFNLDINKVQSILNKEKLYLYMFSNETSGVYSSPSSKVIQSVFSKELSFQELLEY